MSLDNYINIYGTKGATLQYIHDALPKLPIEPFVLVPINGNWRKYKGEIVKLDHCLVRSSSPIEDRGRVSFAGLFKTLEYDGDTSVDKVLKSVDDERVKKYAQIHGITETIRMGLLFHKHSRSAWNFSMLRHPHRSEIFFISRSPVPATFNDNYVFNEETGELFDMYDFFEDRPSGLNQSDPKSITRDIAQGLEAYKLIEKLPTFQDGYTYVMEFGTRPFSIYQFRPFRPKIQANWSINGLVLSEHSFKTYYLTFGITPNEGLELTLVRALCSQGHRAHWERYRSELFELNKDQAVEKLLEQWDLSEPEKVYAEEMVKTDPLQSGSNREEAFSRAIARLNVVSNREDTCLYMENVRKDSGEDIDLIFPNAKVLIPKGGLQFLSHGWFRAMQHYNHILAGYSGLMWRTGDKVRVYGDGVIGKIVKL